MRKQITWIGSSRSDLLALPEEARRKIGHQLNIVQQAGDPDDWKPFATIGAGVREIRVHVEGNQFRSIYVAQLKRQSMCCIASARKSRRPPSGMSISPSGDTS
jgi:phage-related protein